MFAETPQGRQQLRQAVHVGEDGPHPYRQAVHDEPRPDRVHGLLISQPGVRAARVSHALRPSHLISISREVARISTVSVLLRRVGVSYSTYGNYYC